jgi:alkylated DNA repair dioxygenase AlkB
MSETFDLFDVPQKLEPLCMEDADVKFMSKFYAQPLSGEYKDILLDETPWCQEKITLWGKEHWQPRLTAWYGDAGTDYSYSGIFLVPNVWTPTLRQIKSDIEALTGYRFNSVLLNLYRDERDSVGWHADAERELGHEPVIASLSLGETRTFKFKHRTRREFKPLSIDLTDGSLLIMAGSTQQFWLHGVDKERKTKGPRINLTFRNISKDRNK